MKRKSQCVQNFVGVVVAVVLLLLVNAPQSGAQTVTGSILGTIKDSQGAVIANASVTAKSEETGAERTTMTDSSGGFSIMSVPAGAYEVAVTVQGFQSEIQKGLTLTVGAVLRADFTLKVGSFSQQVEVTGEAPQVNTTNATMAGLVDDNSIRELPLNQRDWLQLAVLQTGVVSFNPAIGGNASGSGVKMYISGGRATQNVYRIDGFVVNDYANNSPGSALGGNMGVDAIREFSVLTNTFSAEYGRSAGGVVNSILKSGTNQLHGSAFYFIRNSALDARNFFNPAVIPPFRRSQFGSSIGGPIKKDKLFFFADYEGLRQFQPANSAVLTLSDAARSGVIVCNPATDSACSSNGTKQITISPAMAPYLPTFPHPTSGVTGDTGLYTLGKGSPGTEDYVIGKVDYQLNANNTLSVSYNFDRAYTNVPDAYNNMLVGTDSRAQRAILSFQHVFSPTLLNTFKTGFNRDYSTTGHNTAPALPQISDPKYGWVPGHTMGIFSLGFLGGAGSGGLDVSGDTFWYTSSEAIDDLSWVKGRNNIRIGFYMEAIDDNLYSTSFPAGQWTFNSTQDFLTATNPAQFNADFPGTDAYRSFRQKVFGAYFVDDLRLRSNLTLNLGVRYEPSTVVSEAYNKTSYIVHVTDTPAQTVIGNPIYANPSLRNFAPRVGLAWDPFGNGKTSVRAGFGIYDILQTPNLYNLRLNRAYPYYKQGVINNPCTPPAAACFPTGGLALLSPTSLYTFLIQQNPPAIYKEQWNLNIQRQLTQGLSLTVGYVGSRGVHLPVASNDTDAVALSNVTFVNGHYTFPVPAVTKINPNWARVQSLQWYGYSIYHGLQVTAAQQMKHGFSFNGSYTYSKSMDNGGQEYTANETANSMDNPYDFITELQRGPSDFDIRHNMTASFVWDAPSPHFDMAAARFMLSGWELTGIFSARTGVPFSIGIPTDRAGTGSFRSTGVHVTQRPDFSPSAPGCNATTPQGAVNPGNWDHYLNMACFTYPVAGTLGDLGRNQIRGPSLQNFDFSIFKNNNLFREKLKAQFRAEFFNIFNHTNMQAHYFVPFSSNTSTLPTPASVMFGTGTGIAATVTNSRQIQFGLKLIY